MTSFNRTKKGRTERDLTLTREQTHTKTRTIKTPPADPLL